MADSLLTSIQLQYTPATTTNVIQNPVYYTSTSSVVNQISQLLPLTTAATTISLTNFASATAVVFIQNLDATNFISATFRFNGVSADTTCKILAGGFLYFSGALVLSRNLILTADTATVETYYAIYGN